MTIGERIKKIRIQKGLSQKELADQLGIAPNSLYRYENDMREPKSEMLNKIATALGVNPVDLLFDGNIIFNDKPDKPMEEMTPEEIKKAIEAAPRGFQKLYDTLADAWADENGEGLLYHYRKLNTAGRWEAVKRTEELTHIPKYTDKENGSDGE